MENSFDNFFHIEDVFEIFSVSDIVWVWDSDSESGSESDWIESISVDRDLLY